MAELVLRRRQTVLVALDPPAEFGQLLVSVSDGEATVTAVRQLVNRPIA